ncbi:hypothetical protein JW826_03535 [Candidatus Woesearchaeota archaeon]|nr:hypothetical protein [Candidatus Woesearchaeota archaeon]
MVNEDILSAIEEDTDTTDDGEVIRYIKAFKEESEDMIKNLLYVDSLLQDLERRLSLGENISNEELLKKVKDLRVRVGDIKKEEEAELGEELIANNLLNKLKKWVDQLV